MKNYILIIITILVLFSCQNKEKPGSENIVKAIAEDTLAKTVAGTAAVGDISAKEDEAVKMIRKQLLILLIKDLPVLKKEERFFYYEAFDLNNDKKNEYFVGFSNSYFCGSGGCSGYILNNDGSLINRFTVTDFPILVTTKKTENFYDLIMKSGSQSYLVKMKNEKYPSNPSVLEKWKGKIPEESTAVLDINGKKLEKYSF